MRPLAFLFVSPGQWAGWHTLAATVSTILNHEPHSCCSVCNVWGQIATWCLFAMTYSARCLIFKFRKGTRVPNLSRSLKVVPSCSSRIFGSGRMIFFFLTAKQSKMWHLLLRYTLWWVRYDDCGRHAMWSEWVRWAEDIPIFNSLSSASYMTGVSHTRWIKTYSQHCLSWLHMWFWSLMHLFELTENIYTRCMCGASSVCQNSGIPEPSRENTPE